jgi:hypothetical protein
MRNVRNWSSALATVLVAACAGLTAFSGSALGAQDGINIANFFGSASQNAHLESLIDRLHPSWVRVFVNWDQVEDAPGVYAESQLHAYTALFDALPAGTKVDAVLVGTPSWAGGGTSSPPASDQSFGAFANFLANDFGSRVAAYEIWNEEDSTSEWSGTPAQYVGLLAAAYPAIKAANPNASVILGGLAANDYPYLQELYQAGAQKYFDAVAVHTDNACSVLSPYAFAYNPGTLQINRWSFLGFTTVHSVMAANGDSAKPIYMTELGWATTQSTCNSGSSAGKRVAGVSDKQQALYLRQAYHCLDQPQYSYVAAGMWFDMADFGTQDTFRNRYGLMTYGLQPKPAFKAFAKLSAHGDTLKGTCGNFAGPTLRMYSPYNGEHYSGPLRITVSAKRNGKAPGDVVGQIELFDDGQRIMYFNRVDASYHNGVLRGTIEWQGARSLSPGPHVIMAKVNNANGVMTTVKVTVFHA